MRETDVLCAVCASFTLQQAEYPTMEVEGVEEAGTFEAFGACFPQDADTPPEDHMRLLYRVGERG
jgi:hypothetical protein